MEENLGPDSVDNESDVFERIADKLIRAGLYLTALELYAEMMERGRELCRLREFFDNAKNFEKQPDQPAARQPQHYLQVQSPSEHTFDSCDFSHFSDEQPPVGGADERVAVLEFELRKAQQTINSLRASLTESTTNNNNASLDNSVNNSNNNVNSANNNTNNNVGTNISTSNDNNAQFSFSHLSCAPLDGYSESLANNMSSTMEQSSARMDSFSEFGRGSADGDSCPGEDLPNVSISQNAPALSTTENAPPNSSLSSLSLSKANSLPIKSHEKRALNFLTNEFLMANNYKLTSITFADEIADQDLDRWEDVGLDLERPPELLKLYRQHWQSSLQRSNS